MLESESISQTVYHADGEGCLGTTSGVGVEVVVGPISISASIYGGPSITEAAVVEDERVLDCDSTTNIFGR